MTANGVTWSVRPDADLDVQQRGGGLLRRVLVGDGQRGAREVRRSHLLGSDLTFRSWSITSLNSLYALMRSSFRILSILFPTVNMTSFTESAFVKVDSIPGTREN